MGAGHIAFDIETFSDGENRLVMVQAHLLPLIPLAAVFLARGYGK